MVYQLFINVDLTKVLTELSAPDANPFQGPDIITINKKEKVIRIPIEHKFSAQAFNSI
jgi:hypothetical protein